MSREHIHNVFCRSAAAFAADLTRRQESIEDTLARYEITPDTIAHVVNSLRKTAMLLMVADVEHSVDHLNSTIFQTLLTGAYLHQCGLIPSINDGESLPVPEDML